MKRDIDKIFAMDILDKIGPNVITGTIVVITKRQDNGELYIQDQVSRNRAYTSDYWKNQPNGEHPLYMTQGGIRHRTMPREEKDHLLDFISHHFDEGIAFSGWIKLEKSNEAITQIRIEPKI